MQRNYLTPNWPAPTTIRAYTSLRCGGVSLEPFAGFNLAGHVGDEPQAVTENIALLQQDLSLPQLPVWLTQVHGTKVINPADYQSTDKPEADACHTQNTAVPCCVLTADCLPLLVCNQTGTEVAAIHAGWRGLLAGIIDATIKQMQSPPAELLVWLGPAIGPEAFRVNDQIRVDFIDSNPDNSSAFAHQYQGHWLCDMYKIARNNLQRLGITQIYGGDHCTFRETDKFFSYRRQQTTGRMASLIWIER